MQKILDLFLACSVYMCKYNLLCYTFVDGVILELHLLMYGCMIN